MDSKDAIKQDFLNDECDYITAIERLTNIIGDSKEAEEIVSEWEDSK